jgi:uncharacterized membrane protein
MEIKKISDYRALARMCMRGSYGMGLLMILAVIAVQQIVSWLFSLAASESVVLNIAYSILSILISIIIITPLTVGVTRFFLDQAQGKPDMTNLLYPFKTNLTNVVKVCFIKEVKQFLWYLIPWLIGMGIIAGIGAVAVHYMGSNIYSSIMDMIDGLSAMIDDPNNVISDSQALTFSLVYLTLMGASIIFMIPGIIKAFEYSMIPYIVAENPDVRSKDAFLMTKKMMKGNKLRLFRLGLSFIGWFILGMMAFVVGTLFVLPYFSAAVSQFYIDVKCKAGFGIRPEFTEEATDSDNDTDFGI